MYEHYAIKLAKEFKVESRVSMVSVEIINNWEKLCDQIDELIEQHYSELINQLAASIYNMVIGTDGKLIFKLEVYNDGCPWDYSGNQRTTDQRLDPNEKLYDFLDSEYTGGWEATFVSHYGKRWRTYGDPIR